MALSLLETHSDWSAQELKKGIITRALNDGFDQSAAVGYIPDPLSNTSEIKSIGQDTLDVARTENEATRRLDLDIVLLDGSDR